MLITLQSNSDSDANQFTNFFKEPIQIQPDSEVALVNFAYKFTDSFTVTAGNQDFNIIIGGETITCSVATGSYTSETFLTALNTALTAGIATARYEVQQLFPTNHQKFTWATTKNEKLNLSLAYVPEAWDGALADTGATTTRQEITLVGATQSVPGTFAEASGAGTWVSDYGYSEDNCIWGTAQNVNFGEHATGEFRFTLDQSNKLLFVGLSNVTGALTNAADWTVGSSTMSVGLRFGTGATYVIEERAESTGVTVAVTGTLVYAADDVFKIVVEQTNDNSEENIVRYFQNGEEIVDFLGGAERFPLLKSTKLTPQFSFFTAAASSLSDVSYDVITASDTDIPLAAHNVIKYEPTANFVTLTQLKHKRGVTTLEVEGEEIGAERETQIALVNIDQFQIASMCKDGGVQKAVGTISYGAVSSSGTASAQNIDGQFYYEPYHILYHALGNSHVENHNQMQVRLTDAVGNPLTQLQHPTTVTLDLRPKAKF